MEVTPIDGGVLVRAHGELDAGAAPQLRDALNRLAQDGVQGVVLDLTAVTFMDSMTLAAVIGVRGRLGDDGRLALAVEPGSYALLVLEATGLVGSLDVFPTVGEASDFAIA